VKGGKPFEHTKLRLSTCFHRCPGQNPQSCKMVVRVCKDLGTSLKAHPTGEQQFNYSPLLVNITEIVSYPIDFVTP